VLTSTDFVNEIHRLGIRNILITNHHMKVFAGSELVTYDLALFFKQAGLNVSIATFITGDPIEGLCKQAGIDLINLISQPSCVAGKDFDLVWGHHWPSWGYCINELEVRYRYLVCSSLSPFLPVEAIPSVAAFADKILFNSTENLNVARNNPVPIFFENSSIFPNSLSSQWFNKNTEYHTDPSRQLTKKILVISNHIPKEIAGVEHYLNEQGFTVSYIGKEYEQTLVSPETFKGIRAVITIGHSVQKAIASRISVYCYDHFGGPGWINKSNFDAAQEYNFSGRCSNKKLNSKEIAAEILHEINYPSIKNEQLAQLAFERFDISKNILNVLKSFSKKGDGYMNIIRNDNFFRKATQQYCNQNLDLNLHHTINLASSTRLIRFNIEYLKPTFPLYFFRIDDDSKDMSIDYGQQYKISGIALAKNECNRITKILVLDSSDSILETALIGIPSFQFSKLHPSIPFSASARFLITLQTTPKTPYIDILVEFMSTEKLKVCRISLKDLSRIPLPE
jgi:hypothetical protein